MIDKKSFTKEWIESQKEATSTNRIKVIERCIYAFYLLERLSESKLDFVFKGGTSLMLLSPEPRRFSVDIDIITNKSNFGIICQIASDIKDDYLYDVKEDIRKPKDVIKRHFKFFYHSFLDDDNDQSHYVLLDVVFEENPYVKVEKHKIGIHWLKTDNHDIYVRVPSPEEMVGDKMTAFAPKTIGKLYSEGRYTEICKQLYDIAFLSRIAKDKGIIKNTYDKVSQIEIENRKHAFTEEDAIKDSLEALRIILSAGNREEGKIYFPMLSSGHKALAQSFVIELYGEQEWLCDAAEAYMLYGAMFFKTELKTPAKNSETFIGRRYSLLKRGLGVQRLNELMVMVNNDPEKYSTAVDKRNVKKKKL